MSPENFFSALSDETRLRCVMLIQQKGELCVCELNNALNLSQPKISRHLATLKKIKILKARREGLWMFYSLHPSLPPWFIKVLQDLDIQEMTPFCRDLKNLALMPNRPNTCCKI
ncbi:MAG: metalloregulator ArsR/SmtB family transcription factor [Thiomargarita sp.]|nr:metalloregulator ArsR/SmtB family transcription factor [Thiomargarita sp.]